MIVRNLNDTDIEQSDDIDTGYKVTGLDNRSWISVVDGPEIMIVQYKEGEWVETYPILHEMGYDLLYFKDLEAVNAFLDDVDPTDDTSYKIWECEATGVRPAGNQINNDLWWSMRVGEIENLEQLRYIVMRSTSNNEEYPSGTMMAHRIKLTKSYHVYDNQERRYEHVV